MRGQALPVDQQAFGAAKLEGALAMLQPFLAGGLVRPRPRAIDVRRPEQVSTGAFGGLDRVGPKCHDDLSVRLAHAAPAGARVLQVHAASLERLDARDQSARL